MLWFGGGRVCDIVGIGGCVIVFDGVGVVCRGFVEFSHVFFQVEISAESFSAHSARERFFVVVGVHVEGEVVDLVEGFRTDCAFVGFFSGVGEFVVFVVAFLVESFSAVFADEGFVTGVDSRVSV